MSPDSDDEIDALPLGVTVNGYRLDAVLGRGGVGITYRGEALTGGDPVVIKEFLPTLAAVRVDGMVRARTQALKADYDRLLQAFLAEARTLEPYRALIHAGLDGDPPRPRVHGGAGPQSRPIPPSTAGNGSDSRLGGMTHVETVIGSFLANGTAYRVSAWVPGVALDRYLASLGHRPSEAQVRALLLPVLADLAHLHAAGVLHRGIMPETILVRPDGTPVLIDFGSAGRSAAYDPRSRALMVRSGEGYAPYEQYYRQGRQGPWTDLYALGAVAYRMVTGAPPLDGLLRRLEPDSGVPALEAAAWDYSPTLLAAIDWALSPEPSHRPQSAQEWRAAFNDPASPEALLTPSPKKPVLPLAGIVFAVAMVVFGTTAVLWHRGHPKSVPIVTGMQSGVSAVPEVAEDEPDRLRPGSVFRDCADTDAVGTAICPQMVVIPAGTFQMGSPAFEEGRHANEGPQHEVSIAYPLAVGRFAVTFAEWDACVAAGGCGGHRPGDKGWGHGRRPVINVSWDDAHRYVAWLGQLTGQPYRLLSEAEWEYAARAGTVKARYWGNQLGRNQGNCSGCGSAWDGRQTAPVGSFPANRFGLNDMLGNVWQWVEDCYREGYDGAPNDGSVRPSAGCGYRVVRGGSWFTTPSHLRSAYRGGSSSSSRGDDNGFRVARPVTVELLR